MKNLVMGCFISSMFLACDFEKPGDIIKNSAKPSRAKKNVEREIINDSTITLFYKDGRVKKLAHITTKKDGNEVKRKYEGKTTYYYPNGTIKSEINYTDNQRHKQSKTFFENGHLKVLENYESGKLHGEKIKYYLSGKVHSINEFDNGRPVKSTIFYNLDGKKQPEPKLGFVVDDLRIQKGIAKITINAKSIKRLSRISYKLLIKTDSGFNFEKDLTSTRGNGFLEIPVRPSDIYIAKLYVTGKYQLKSGEIGAVVDTYNLYLEPLL